MYFVGYFLRMSYRRVFQILTLGQKQGLQPPLLLPTLFKITVSYIYLSYIFLCYIYVSCIDMSYIYMSYVYAYIAKKIFMISTLSLVGPSKHKNPE